MATTTEPETKQEQEQDCRDCFGRDVFRGQEPDAPTAPFDLQAPPERRFRDYVRAHKRIFLALLGVVAITVFVAAVLPQIAGFGDTIKRIREGDKSWLALGVLFEALSIGSYIAVFRAVFSCEGVRIDWRESYQITLAGLVATKLFAAAGAGGVALTAWALRAAGLRGRTVAERLATFEILLYSVYMACLAIFGLGLVSGLFSGEAPTGVTVIPAAFGAGVIVLALLFRFIPNDMSHLLGRLSGGSHRRRRLLEGISTIPTTIHDGVVGAIRMVRRPRIGLLGAVGYWAFDIGCLWAAFHAYGAAPPIAVVVMSYFVGTLANVIPIPGGVGGVEGGMIGCFIAFGVDGSTAVLAVLSYRALSFWLPTIPGAFAYFQLRRTVGEWRAVEPAAEPSPAG
jgi:putative heme transporter